MIGGILNMYAALYDRQRLLNARAQVEIHNNGLFKSLTPSGDALRGQAEHLAYIRNTVYKRDYAFNIEHISTAREAMVNSGLEVVRDYEPETGQYIYKCITKQTSGAKTEQNSNILDLDYSKSSFRETLLTWKNKWLQK